MTRATPAKSPRETAPGPTRDPVAPWCADVLALFSAQLADVHFPEVDAAALEAAGAAARAAQLEAEAAERALDDARARTREATATLAELCARGLAYARVFATTQPELQAAIAAVRPRADRPSAAGVELAPRKRGRPRTDSSTAPLLPDDAATTLAQ